MKPFDLAAAQRGEPLITRDGRKAWFIGVAPVEMQETQPVVVWVDREVAPDIYRMDGRFFSVGDGSYSDLFMAQTKQTRWLVVWRSPEGNAGSTLCSSQKDCDAAADALSKEGFTILTSDMKRTIDNVIAALRVPGDEVLMLGDLAPRVARLRRDAEMARAAIKREAA